MAAPPLHTLAGRLATFKKHESAPDKWPLPANHSITPAELAAAGFYHAPISEGQDNASCCWCDKSLGGWEEGDIAIQEHLNHTIKKGNVKKACAFAILQSGGRKIADIGLKEGKDLVKLRKETFGKKNGWWKHEGRRGWPTADKLANAGFHLNVREIEGDDVSCCWCGIQLNSWAKGDVPIDEHRANSPDCYFFNQSKPFTESNSKIAASISEATIKAKRPPKISAISDDDGWQQFIPQEVAKSPTASASAKSTTNSSAKTATTSANSHASSSKSRQIDSDSESESQLLHEVKAEEQQSIKPLTIARSGRTDRLKSIATTLEVPPSMSASKSSQDVAALLGVSSRRQPSEDPVGRLTRSGRVTSAQQIAQVQLHAEEAPQTAPIAARQHGILHVLAPLSVPNVGAAQKQAKSGKTKARMPTIAPNVQANMAEVIATAAKEEQLSKAAAAVPQDEDDTEMSSMQIAEANLERTQDVEMDPRLFEATPAAMRIVEVPAQVETMDLSFENNATLDNSMHFSEAYEMAKNAASDQQPDQPEETDDTDQMDTSNVFHDVEEDKPMTFATPKAVLPLHGSLLASISPLKAIHDFFRPAASPQAVSAINQDLSPIKRAAPSPAKSRIPQSPVARSKSPIPRAQSPLLLSPQVKPPGISMPLEFRPMSPLQSVGSDVVIPNSPVLRASPIKSRIPTTPKAKQAEIFSTTPQSRPVSEEPATAAPPIVEESVAVRSNSPKVTEATPKAKVLDTPILSALHDRTPTGKTLRFDPVKTLPAVPTSLAGYTEQELKMPIIELYRSIMQEVLVDTERQLRVRQADFRQNLEDGRRAMRELGIE